MVTKTPLTAKDLWNMAAGDVRRELVNGEVVEMVPAGGVHGNLTAKICRFLVDHVLRHGGGQVVVGDVGFVLNLAADPERVRAPDVAYISSQRLTDGKLPPGFIHQAPDLAVEVLSPSETSDQMQQKLRDYLEAGVRLIWVVAPESKSVTAYWCDGSARFLRETDSLDGGDVLPGLAILLKDIFD